MHAAYDGCGGASGVVVPSSSEPSFSHDLEGVIICAEMLEYMNNIGFQLI